jgi:hypothetical protein
VGSFIKYLSSLRLKLLHSKQEMIEWYDDEDCETREKCQLQ